MSILTLADKEIRLDDANTVGAFQRQLEYREAEVLKRMLPEYPAAAGKLMQIETLNIPWAKSTSYTSIDGVGRFELDNGSTTNMPYVDLVGNEYNQRTFAYRNGYYFDEDEVAATLQRSIPIEDMKIELVQQSFVETIERLMMFGDVNTGLPGLTNHPAWLRSQALFKLDGSTTNPNQILATLNAGVQGVKDATNKVVRVDTLLLPERRFDFLMSQLRINEFQETSVLRYFLMNNPSIRNIEPVRELEGAGPNGEDIAIFYKRDPKCFKARFTDALRPRPLIQDGPYKVYRGYKFKFNGLIVYRRYCVHVVIGV